MLSQEEGKWEKLNVEAKEITIDLLEELQIKVSLKQEETTKHMVKYYNYHIKEKHFKVSDLVLKKLNAIAP